MHPIPCLTRGNNLATGIVFVNRHRQTLCFTNQTIIWNARGANGAVAGFHVIKTNPLKPTQVDVYLSTLPFGNGQGYPILERGVATAINLHEFKSFFSVKVEGLPSSGRKAGLRLSIRNLILNGESNGKTIIVPELPTGWVNTPERWFVGMGNALVGSGMSKIIFRGGGNVMIPDWFVELCRQLGIDIVILEPEAFDQQFPDNPIVDNTPFENGEHE